MSKLPSITPRVIIAFLKAKGFSEDHATGSHFVFHHPITRRRAVVPRHPKDLPKGTLFAILREAGFSRKELAEFLNQ
ncbi:MAG: type II toxin-antitoxin system HicA family toxin [Parcubacteria group bacterium]|nr:type II toxin-antitoxin system HicA family toxin [Parcubacteria group bacterium]